MPDDFNPFDFDPYILLKRKSILSRKIKRICCTKSVNDNLSNENKKDRKRSDKQFWLSLSIAILGVIIGVLGLIF